MAKKYITWPVGTKLGVKELPDEVQWTIEKVDGDAMTLTRTRWQRVLQSGLERWRHLLA